MGVHRVFVLGVASPLFLSTGASAATLINGSFEDGIDPGAYTTVLGGNSTSIGGWTVGGHSVDYIGTHWQAQDGNRSIDLAGGGDGSLFQSFATIAGVRYDVSFWVGRNPDGGADPRTGFARVDYSGEYSGDGGRGDMGGSEGDGDPYSSEGGRGDMGGSEGDGDPYSSADARGGMGGSEGEEGNPYSGEGTRAGMGDAEGISFPITYFGSGDRANMEWEQVTFSFVATGTASTLSFASDPNTSGDFYGLALDNVTIAAAVPEPATWATMLLGFGLVGGTMRRRRTDTTARIRFA